MARGIFSDVVSFAREIGTGRENKTGRALKAAGLGSSCRLALAQTSLGCGSCAIKRQSLIPALQLFLDC